MSLKAIFEDLPNVAYSLREPDAFRGDRILVVGGGDSAVEASLALAEDNQVRISYRRDSFSRIKPANRERVKVAIDAGRLEVFWSTNLQEISPASVTLSNGSPDTVARRIENDYTFIFAGGELPTDFLRACGVEIETKFGEV